MINFTSALTLCAALTCCATSMVSAPASAQEHYPFSCKMNALSPAERKELPKWLDSLVAMKPVATELENGFSLEFAHSGKAFPLASKWISCESRCCPFFEFAISLTPNDGPLTIRITGPAGVKEFIADDLPKIHTLTTSRSTGS